MVSKHKDSSTQLQMVANNVTASLRQMGLKTAIAEVNEEEGTVYIVFTKEDLINVIKKKVKSRLRKDLKGKAETVVGEDADIIFIKVKKL